MTITTPSQAHAKTVGISAEELKNKKYGDKALSKALEALHQDGLVVLKGVVDLDHIAALNRQMSIEAEQKRDDPSQTYNHAVKCECSRWPQ